MGRMGQLLLAGALAASCGPRQPPSDSALSSGELSGKVLVTGSQPHTTVTLVPDQGQGVTLVGDLQGELARLSGAEVRVRGAQRGNPPAGSFEVESYVVTGIDGEVPTVGILTATGDALTLVGTDTVELADVPDELRDRTGAKVWIVGPVAAGKLAVQSYGILREGSQ